MAVPLQKTSKSTYDEDETCHRQQLVIGNLSTNQSVFHFCELRETTPKQYWNQRYLPDTRSEYLGNIDEPDLYVAHMSSGPAIFGKLVKITGLPSTDTINRI